MTHLCSLQVWPEHIDHQNPEDQQVPSPAEEKQISKVGEKKRSWMKPLLRSVALGLSLMDVYASIVLVIYSLSPYRALFLENPSKDRPQHCQKVCLQLETLHILIACQNMIHEFERDIGVEVAMHAQVDTGVAALPNLADQCVVTKWLPT
jgi:hypothetical protein